MGKRCMFFKLLLIPNIAFFNQLITVIVGDLQCGVTMPQNMRKNPFFNSVF